MASPRCPPRHVEGRASPRQDSVRTVSALGESSWGFRLVAEIMYLAGQHLREERNDMRALLSLLTWGLVVAVSACATTPSPPPPTVDVSGTWVGTWSALQGSGSG